MSSSLQKIIVLLALAVAGCKDLGGSRHLSELVSANLTFKSGPGSIGRTADAGAGPYASKPWTWEKWRSRELLQAELYGAGWVYGQDAARHLWHYFENTGTELQIDAKRFFNECPGARRLRMKWLREAFAYVNQLPEGQHEFSLTANDQGQCKKDESINWYYATGGFNVYFRGVATVEVGESTHRSLRFVSQHYDRYNWDKGDSFTIGKTQHLESDMG